MKFFIGLLAVLVCSVFAIEFDRPCRTDVEAKDNFAANFYTGTWYELYNSVDNGDECVDHHYTRRLLNNTVFDVERVSVVNGEFVTVNRVVHLAFPDESPIRAIFNATIVNENEEEINYNYRIVATDYTNYAVGWACADIDENRSVEEGIILGRGIQLNNASYVKVEALLQSNGLNLEDFRFILHTPEACGLTPPEENSP